MSPESLTVPVAILACAAGLRAWAGAGEKRSAPGRPPRALVERLPLPAVRSRAALRIARAGTPAGIGVGGLALARLAGALGGAASAALVLGVLPARLVAAAGLALVAGGFFLPDLLLERAARRRRAAIMAALPDAVEVLAVGAGGGRSTRAALTELARGGSGSLARELSIAIAEIECGRPPSTALADLRRRLPGPELGGVLTSIERSARFGSPLVDHLHRHAAGLREGHRRRLAEHAARAAPKIQLVIALILVPSVLLLLAAALIANSDSLLSGL